MKVLNVLVASDDREQQEIAAAAGISAGYLSQILKGDRPLTVRVLAGLARALRTNPEVLATDFTTEELIELAKLKGLQEQDRQEPAATEAPAPLAALPIPTLDLIDLGDAVRIDAYQYIAAGPLTDEALTLEEQKVLVPPAYAKCLALRVRGTSMVEDDIRDGDLVLVDQAAVAKDGDTVLAEVGNGSTIAILRTKGRTKVLAKASPDHRDIPIRREEGVVVRGVVVGVLRERRKKKP